MQITACCEKKKKKEKKNKKKKKKKKAPGDLAVWPVSSRGLLLPLCSL